jgi:phosphate transport system permease protein
VSLNLITNTNPSTIAANIALKFPESSGVLVNALIFTGLVLFVITFLVNLAARAFLARRSEFDGAN